MLNVYGASNALRLSYDATHYISLASSSAGDLTLTSSATTESALIVGNNTAQNTSIIFDNLTQDFYAGIDNADSVFKIGSGQTIGTSPWFAIKSTGNVGIGTTTPTAKLHLNGVSGTVTFELNSNETAGNATNNILMLRSDVASADDPVFRIQANGAVYADGAYSNGGADYAEYFYTKDTDLQSGEAVCIDPTKTNAIQRCQNNGDNNIMGIVSSKPSIIGNKTANQENDPTHYAIIGMLGQVAGKVSNENGDLKVGDSLTASSTPGLLRKANAGESTVGIAMENFNDKAGTIQVLISRRNQSLTVEKVQQQVSDNIAAMNLKDQVDNLVAQASTNLDKQLADQITTLTNLQTQITDQADITAKLQKQIEDLKLQNQKYAAFDQLIANISNIDNLIFKDSLGNLDLTGGKITAQDIQALGLIEAQNIEAKDSLKAENLQLGDQVSGTGVVKAGQLESDKIATTQIKIGSKLYITAKGSTQGKMLYYDEADIEEGVGFKVKIDAPALDKDVEFNWLIVK